MARKRIGKIREVKVDLSNYTYLINGVAGIGKTTTVCEIGQKEFGIDGFLLLTIGEEPEPEHIGNLWNAKVSDWDELEETIDELCEYKDEDYKELRMVGIDSVDEVFRLAENKVVEMHNAKVKPADRINTIKSAFGGFQAGNNMVIDMVAKVLFKLRSYGVSLFFIGHTKQKNKTDLLTEIEYEQITSNLDNKYYNCIKDKVNIVMCAYMEREFTDLKVRKDAFTKTNKDVGVISKETRVVAFRDDGFAIDTKSHLKYIVPKCELDSDVIIKELKDAMKKQANIYSDKPLSDEEVEEKAKEQREEVSRKVPSKPVDNIDKKEEMLANIQSNMAKLDMSKLQEVMTKYSITSFGDVSVIPIEALEEIIALI